MKVLLTGARGQLGSSLSALLAGKQGVELTATDRGTLDVTNREAVLARVRAVRPDWIINATAYTDVERAESEAERAFLVNDVATGHLADAAYEVRSRLLHVSTDYVFSGRFEGPPRPYVEEDVPEPLNVYGASKLAGEIRLSQHPARSLVVRTSWLFGGAGKSFLSTMLRVGRSAMDQKKPVRVVNDQWGTPTEVGSFSGQLVRLLGEDLAGLVHAPCSGATTWYQFACAIFEAAGLAVEVQPITTAEYPTKARRPAYSVLDARRLRTASLHVLPDWREGLRRALAPPATGSDPA